MKVFHFEQPTAVVRVVVADNSCSLRGMLGLAVEPRTAEPGE